MQQAQHRKRSPYSIASFLLLLIYALAVCSTCNAVPKYFYIVNEKAGDGRCAAIWDATNKHYDKVAKRIEDRGITFFPDSNKPVETGDMQNTFYTDATGAATCVDNIFSKFPDHEKLLAGVEPVTFICFGGDGTFGQVSEALYNKRMDFEKKEAPDNEQLDADKRKKKRFTYRIAIMSCGTGNSMCRGLEIPIIPSFRKKKAIKSALMIALVGDPVCTSMFKITPLTDKGEVDTEKKERYASMEIDIGCTSLAGQLQSEGTALKAILSRTAQYTVAAIQASWRELPGEVTITASGQKAETKEDEKKEVTFIAGTTAGYFGGNYQLHINQDFHRTTEGLMSMVYYHNRGRYNVLPVTIVDKMSFLDKMKRSGTIKNGLHIEKQWSHQILLRGASDPQIDRLETVNSLKLMHDTTEGEHRRLQIDGELTEIINFNIEALLNIHQISAMLPQHLDRQMNQLDLRN